MRDLSQLVCPNSKDFVDIEDYCDYLYECFCADWIEDPPDFLGQEVIFNGTKKTKGKEETFWKLIGTDESILYRSGANANRVPHFKRAERIRWIKQIIVDYPDKDIRHWIESDKQGLRHHLYYKEDYIVVIGEYKTSMVLITGFYVLPKNKPHYEKQYQQYKKKMSP